MNNGADSGLRLGILSAAGSYVLWGVLPAYWKLLNALSAWEILAHRVVWSFAFMLIVLIACGKMKPFMAEVRLIFSERRKLIGVVLSSVLISSNWLIYIWAVNANHIIETSLGYYINPLLSVVMGIVVLKEKLTLWQAVSFLLVTAGVLHLTLVFGAIPWAALLLAITFAFYGLAKKQAGISAITGITLETFFAVPVALAYLLWMNHSGSASLVPDERTWGFLVGTGVVTVIPLLLFSQGAISLPLKMLGFLQYLSPTISLLIGVFFYQEPFTMSHAVSFGCIWLALTLFSLSGTKPFVVLEAKLRSKYASI